MPLEIVTVALCGIVLIAMVGMLLVALTGIVDPTTFTRCHECSHWMSNSHHQTCFHCRHAAHLPFVRH